MPCFAFDDFILDTADERLRRAGVPVPLTPKAVAVLRHLAERSGRLVTKDELLTTVWAETYVTEGVLKGIILEIRKALEDSAVTPRYIQTVHRRGYRFLGAVAGGEMRAPAFVGRNDALVALDGFAHTAAMGKRQLVLVTGEPGIGKTALLDAFEVRFEDDPSVLITRGQCIEQYGAGEPYLPLLDALGRLIRDVAGPAVVRTLRQSAPTWLLQLPAAVSEADRETLERQVRGATRERMLRELAEALEQIAAHRLLVLVLEDLHWSDQATLDLLSFMARRTQPAHLLVLGSYRPVDAIIASHPLRALHHELLAQGRCRELSLDRLDRDAVRAMVSARLGVDAWPADLPALVHARTDGNPLFVVNVLDYLTAQDHLGRDGTRWVWRQPPRELERAVPESLRLLIERQLARLDPEDRRVLEAASVAGGEPSAAAVAAAAELDVVTAEARCETVARNTDLLVREGASEWPDGTVATRYAFGHALYRDVLYDGVALARRSRMHALVGERLEVAHMARSAEIAAALASHFAEARDDARAAKYHRLAAENAARRNAHAEAIALVQRARFHLARTPEGFERLVEELLLAIAAGPALMMTHGYAAPEVQAGFTRAREICRQLGDGPQLFPILWGLWAYDCVSGRLHVGDALAQQCMDLATVAGDPDLMLEAHHAMWVTRFFQGRLAEARRHIEAGLPLYDRSRHDAHVALYGQDPGVAAYAYLGITLLAQGRTAQGREAAAAAVRLGRALGHPTSLVFGLHFAAWFHEQCREPERVLAITDELEQLTTVHGLPFWHAHARWFHGRAQAETGDVTQGIETMRQSIAALQATGARMGVPSYLTTLARVTAEAGRCEEATALLDEAERVVGDMGEEVNRAELLRSRGELLVRTAPHRGPRALRFASAESCFREAIAVAQQQGSVSLELRATTALARLLAHTDRGVEGRRLLRAVLARLEEGGDLRDAQEASAMLRGRPARSPRSATR